MNVSVSQALWCPLQEDGSRQQCRYLVVYTYLPLTGKCSVWNLCMQVDCKLFMLLHELWILTHNHHHNSSRDEGYMQKEKLAFILLKRHLQSSESYEKTRYKKMCTLNRCQWSGKPALYIFVHQTNAWLNKWPNSPYLECENFYYHKQYLSSSFILQKNAGVAVATFSFLDKYSRKLKSSWGLLQFTVCSNLQKYCSNRRLIALSK